MHGNVNPGHTVSPAPTCTVASCHAGASDLAAIHAVVTGRSDSGCGICHAPGKVPTAVCAATGCHPTGPPTKHSSHPATITSGTVTINGAGYGKHLCSECHATTELQAVHGGTASCVKCHPAPRSSFTTWNKTCVQGDCHKPGTTLAMHGGIDSAHTASAAAACTLAGCHTGGSDVAAVHASKLGCPTCHASGRTPTLVCAASGCHPDGAPANHDAHPATVTSGTITINAQSYGRHLCSECHVTLELQALHGGATKCASCHPTPRDSFTTWTGGCIQGTCHSSSSARPMHGFINASHTLGSPPSCTVPGCHSGGNDIAKIHLTKGGCAACHSPGVTASRNCTGCHPGDVSAAHASYVGAKHQVAANGCVTSDCHSEADAAALHAPGLGCVDCHTGSGTPVLTCATCHPGTTNTVHATAVGTKHAVPAGACVNPACHVSGDAAEIHGYSAGCVNCHKKGQTPSIACASCHGAGTISSSHPSGTASHLSNLHPCTGSCHGNDVAVIHANSQKSCAACHASGAGTTTACTASQCHPIELSYAHVQYAAVNEFHRGAVGNGSSDWGWESDGWILPPYTRGASLPCTACHDVAGTTNLHNFPTVVNGKSVTVTTHNELGNLCVACHGGTPDDWHRGCFDCHGGGMGLNGPTSMAELLADPRYPDGCADCHQHGAAGWPHGPGWMTGATL
jgi:hypothetical protein